MESIGFITTNVNETGKIEVNYYQEKTPESEPILICSFDECSHIETKATAGVLTAAKRLMKHIVLPHYEESPKLPSPSKE